MRHCDSDRCRRGFIPHGIGRHLLRCYGDYGAGLGLSQCATRVIDCIFEGCDRNGIGQLTGDIFVYDESLLVESCHFLGNHAGIGGAILEDVDGDVVIRDCWFEGNSADQSGGAVYLAGASVTCVIEDCLFWDNHALNAFGGGLLVHQSTEIRGCTFVGNSSDAAGAALRITNGSSSLQNCIIANSTVRPAVGVTGGSLSSTCNVFWNNEAGISYNWTPDPTDFEADPLFCDPDNGDFELSSQSPCLPPASGDCGLIGAFGEGCGIVSVEDSSWGLIKGQYIGENGGGR